MAAAATAVGRGGEPASCQNCRDGCHVSLALRHCLQPALPKLRTRLLQTPFDVARSSLFLSLCVASRRVASAVVCGSCLLPQPCDRLATCCIFGSAAGCIWSVACRVPHACSAEPPAFARNASSPLCAAVRYCSLAWYAVGVAGLLMPAVKWRPWVLRLCLLLPGACVRMLRYCARECGWTRACACVCVRTCLLLYGLAQYRHCNRC